MTARTARRAPGCSARASVERVAQGFLARLLRRYDVVADLGTLRERVGDRVEIEGIADPTAVLEDPLTGERCIALDYRAYPPSTTIGIDGGTAHNGRAYQMVARQAVDFSLGDGPISVLVRVEAGEDVAELHARLVEQFGVGLRAETDRLVGGQRIGVAGRVRQVGAVGSPHRTAPQTIVVVADRYWPVG